MLVVLFKPRKKKNLIFVCERRTTKKKKMKLFKEKSVVKLNSTIIQPKKIKENKVREIVILHGLLGRGIRWQAIGNWLSSNFGLKIHLVDLRNHGTSEHHPEMCYLAITNDLNLYFEDNKIQNSLLIGHSMVHLALPFNQLCC